MASKEKNKASQGWISKLINYKRKLTQEERELSGSISIAISATAFSNCFTISPDGNLIIPCYTGYIILVFGLLFLMYGFWITPSKNRKLWSRIEILLGVAFFFIGLRIVPSNLSMVITGQFMGWAITIGAMILIIIGVYLWHKAKTDNKNDEPEQEDS